MAEVLPARKRAAQNIDASRRKRVLKSEPIEERDHVVDIVAAPSVAGKLVEVPPQFKFAEQTSEFSPGAIISIRLVDFQVASDSTFRFGPYLNLVVGSNGTGKSTIVNAIYLLFRGKLSNLDRKTYGEFVRHGSDQAVVSAQIQGALGEMNPVIAISFGNQKRLPGQPASRPTWFYNGQSCTEEYIDRVFDKLSIQVNNLCQFLPQFRVAAFSGESAQERLISTEKAIGYDGMLEDHQKLADAGSELSELTKEVESLTVQTQQLQEKKDFLHAKMLELEAANEDKEKIDFLMQLLEVARYSASKKEIDKLKSDLETARKELEQFDEDTATKRAHITEATSRCQALQTELEAEQTRIGELEQVFEGFEHARKLREANCKDIVLRLSDEKESFQSSVGRLDRLDNELSDLKLEARNFTHQLNSLGTDTERFESLQQQSEQAETKHTALDSQIRSINDQEITLNRQRDIKQNDKAGLSRKLEHLRTSHSGARSAAAAGSLLRGDQGSLERNVAFVEANQHRFEKPVILPAILSLKILDQNVLPLFCEAISYVHLQKFVCQTAKDQELLAKLADDNQLDIRTTFLSPSFEQSKGYRGFDAPVLAKFRSLGLEASLLDRLDGPEAMIKFMRSLGAHKILYGPQIQPDARREIRSLTDRIRFADRTTFYTISQSKYGQKSVTEMSKPLNVNSPRWATFMLHKDKSGEIARIETDIVQADERIANIKYEIEQLATKKADLKQELSDTKTFLRALNSKLGNERVLREKLAIVTRRIANMEDKKSEMKSLQQSRQENIKVHAKKLQTELAALEQEYSNLPPNFISQLQFFFYWKSKQEVLINDAKCNAELLSQALEAERSNLGKNVEVCEGKIKAAKDASAELRRNYTTARNSIKAKGKLEEANQLLKDKTVFEIEDDLNRLNAVVSLQNQRTESLESVRQKYQLTESQLEEDSRRLSIGQHRLSNLSRDTQDTRAKWESGIKSMVSSVSERFSQMFQKLGCRGSVTLDCEDPLAIGTWGVDINLAFRQEEEAMSKLSKFRQSGGERAISTAIYLLALQHLANAPFRVLDEINQGMDEKNERVTMKFFVDMACKKNEHTQRAQQYFLITPKLISNVPCHPNMNITFIFGGLAIGNSDKLLPSTVPTAITQALEEEIESENEDEDSD